MKRLLTFVYGLLLFGLSFIAFYQFDHITEWYRWIYAIAGVLIVLDAFAKLDRATT